MPLSIADLNNIPIKYTDGQTVFLKDVGQVHDGWAVQQNIVRTGGHRSVLLSVVKNGSLIKRSLTSSATGHGLPAGLNLRPITDRFSGR